MRRVLPKIIIVVLLLAVAAVSLSINQAPDQHPVPPSPSATVPAVTPLVTPPPPEETPEPTPEPEPEYFTVTMVGDCTLSSGPYYDSTPEGYRSVVGDDYAYPFAETVHLLNEDDFTIANLECVLSTRGTQAPKTFVFRADPAYANIMVEGSVEFVTLGNNHVLDYGEQGYADTKAALDEVGISYAGRDEWTLYETDSGLLIGVYAVSFGTESQIAAGISALKEAGAEFIIAALHWGDEGAYNVNKDQISQGHAAIDAGADIVYGSHPHTLQPIEEYKGKYIYYSVGNWSFGGNTNPRDKDTVLIRLTLMRDADGTVSVVQREHIPCSSSGKDNANNYQPVPLEEGSERWNRTLSKLDGTFTGSNLSIGYEYSNAE